MSSVDTGEGYRIQKLLTGIDSRHGIIRLNVNSSDSSHRIIFSRAGTVSTTSTFNIIDNLSNTGNDNELQCEALSIHKVSSNRWLITDYDREVTLTALRGNTLRWGSNKLPTNTLYSTSGLNASNLTSGTISDDRLPTSISASRIPRAGVGEVTRNIKF